jgi:hypothetical protein
MATRATLVLLLALIPGTTLAQTSTAGDVARTSATGDPAQFVADSGLSDGSSAEAVVVQQTQPYPPPTQQVQVLPRRRGSMVGYIEDATIGSQIRFRFDTAFHNHVPDRTEFFYAKCGCYRDLVNVPALFDPEAPGPGPGVVTDMNFQQMYIQAEYAGGGRVSVFAEMPIRWIKPQAFADANSFPNQSGFGDLQGGVKIGLAPSDTQSVTLQIRGYLPTGDAEKGLGTHHQSIEPSLLLNNVVGDRVTIGSEVGWWHPFGGSLKLPNAQGDKFAGDVIFYGVGPAVEVYRSSNLRLGPVIELVGWRVLSGSQTIAPGTELDDASGTNIVNLKIGGRVVVEERHSVYAGWGKALTDADWYDSIFRFEYRYSF